MNPIFVVGGSRTGSELIRNILNTYSDIELLPEMALMYPRHLHRDFMSSAKHILKRLKDDRAVEELVDLMYSKTLYGMFWKHVDGSMGIERGELMRRLLLSDRTPRDILAILMEMCAESHGKSMFGAKFPVHIAYVSILREWFPGCKLIHTIRDPRASYASQARKREARWGLSIGRFWERLLQYIHINIQFRSQARVHERLKSEGNYFLLRYEDVVRNPESVLRAACDFLEIEFKNEMLKPTLRNSSYGEINRVPGKIEVSSLYSWKDNISSVGSRLMMILNRRQMQSFYYV